MKIFDQFEGLLEELQEEEGHLSDDQIELLIGKMLVPELCLSFAAKYSEMSECFDYDESEDYLNDLFGTFAKMEGLSEGLQDAVATAINAATMYEATEVAPEIIYSQPADTDEDDIDDNEVVFNIDDWKKLTDAERKKKVAAFLKKLAAAHSDARDGKPWLKNMNIGDQPDPFGNRFGQKVRVFDREKNRFGHPNEGIKFPNIFTSEHGEDPRSHPLHQTLLNHGYAYSHTTPVNQRDGSIHNHHVWQHPMGHRVSAYANDSRWSAKVSSSSGHSWEGIGKKALEKHLASKARRYKNANESALPHVDILENLLSGHDKVQRYADFMKNNPAIAFGHAGSYAVGSPKNDLLEAHKMKTAADKRFKQGKKRRDWKLFDMRKGQPK